MKTIKVKICGIRSLDSALAAINAGADFLGFNFIPSSKRYIKPILAQKIIQTVKGKVAIVGVFQNQESEEVHSIAGQLELDYVQLHGKESPKYVKTINVPVIKFFTTKTVDMIDHYNIAYALVDREIQGEGKKVSLEKISQVPSHTNIFLAGGLTPKNIKSILKRIQPFAVDVASGIETHGVEDAEKIKEFVGIVKGGSL